MKERLKSRFDNIVRYPAVRIWFGFMALLCLLSLLAMFFLDRYRGYGVNYIFNKNEIKYENSGMIFYGGSSVFMTLLLLSLISLVFLFIFCFVFPKSKVFLQILLTSSIFIFLLILSFFYAPPTANFKVTVYNKDLSFTEYAWARPVLGSRVDIIETTEFSGYSEVRRLSNKVDSRDEYLSCVKYYFYWVGSFQIKKYVWPTYVSRIFGKTSVSNYCYKLTEQEANSLSAVDKKNAGVYFD